MGQILRCVWAGSRLLPLLACLFVIPLFGLLGVASAPADDKLKFATIPAGSASQEVDVGGKQLKLFTYKPKDSRKGPLLLVFHGADRNADDYRDAAIPLANRHGGLVVAPLFDAERF